MDEYVVGSTPEWPNITTYCPEWSSLCSNLYL